MSTPILDLREPVRAFLGDFDANVRKYQDSAIDVVVKTVVRMGKVPGFTISGSDITPTVTAPETLALLVYHTCLAFVAPNTGDYSYRTRAISERFGSQRDFLHELKSALYELENAPMFNSWTSFNSWATGVTGINLWGSLTRMTVDAPVAEVRVGRDGLTVNE